MKTFKKNTCLIFGPLYYDHATSLRAYGSEENEADVKEISLEEVADNLRKEGASEEVVDRLLEKLKNGETWDSMNPRYKDL